MLVLTMMLALWLVVVPLVFAGPGGPAPDRVAAQRPVVAKAAAQLPRCTIIGTQGDDVLVGTAGDDVICGLGGDDVIHGRGGDDILFGSFGDDVLDGGPGNDELRGHWGRDRLLGGPGDDLLHGGGNADVLSGGSGSDTADYSTRVSPVRVSIGSGGADDGVTGENDDVRPDVENVLGGSKGDTLVGSGKANRLDGRGGNDVIEGGRGNDRMFGGRGVDRLDGRDAARFRDRLNCGPGRGDSALADARDQVSGNCENVNQPERGRNHAPTNVKLSNDRVAENQPAGTLVGTLRAHDPDKGDELRFSLVAGSGDADNAAFRIDGADLRTAAVFDFETKSRYSIRVRVSDGHGGELERTFVIAVTDVAENVNHAPTDVSLSPASVAENQPAGTTVGTLAATDADAGQAHSFALVAGAGDTDNAAFMVSGDRLQSTQFFDYENKRTYSIRVATTDAAGATFAKALTVTITDVNEAPTGLSLSNATLPENEPAGTAVGNLSVTDPDVGQAHTFTLVSGTGDADNGKFSISGSTLETAQVLDFESQPTYSIRVRATDGGTPALSVEETFTITVTDTDEPPAAADRSATTAEDTPVTITLSASDPEGDDITQFLTSAASHGTPGAVGPITCAGTPKFCTADVSFTPDANYNGPAGFTYTAGTASQVSAPATVSVTVEPVNDAPVATSGTRSTSEDAPLTLDLAALASDVETSPANLVYTIVSQPAHGTATATTYTPNANFNGTDSLTFKVTDRGDPDNCGAPGPGCDAPKSSSTRTVSITVDPVNDAPIAADAGLTTDEDTPLAIDLTALVSDVETADANLTYAIVTQPAHGALTGSGGARTYTPAANFNGPDSFTYRVTDRGDPDNCAAAPCDGPKTSSTRTVSITVGAVNDAPVNLLPAGPVSAVQETNTPIGGLSVTDIDAGADSVQLTLSALHGTLTVSTSVLGGVGTLQVVGNATKSVVVTASLAQINTTLADANGLVYHGDVAFTGPDTLTMATDDLGHNGAGGAKTDTDTLAINVVTPNQPPVAAAQNVSTNEDTAKAITLSASDADGDALTLAKGTGPSHGSLGSIGSVTCSGATPNVCTASVTYTPSADYNGPDSFTFTANDGRDDSAPATVSITVNPVNDAPVLANTEAGALAYTENDPATIITAATTVSDIDSANFDTGTLTVDYSSGGTADDLLEIRNQGTGAGEIGVSGANVTFAGTTIGAFAGGSGTTPLVVTLNANATPAAAQALVRNVTYRNVSDAPSTAARTVRFVLTDGDGGTSNPATRAIALTAVNDAPVLAGIEATAVGYVESVDSAPSQSQITNTLTVADPDNSNLAGATVQITGACQSSEDVLVFSNQNGITGTYTAANCLLTLTGSASVANYQAALRSVKYETTSDTPNTTTRTVTFQVDDGQSASHASNTQARDVTVTASNDSPTGADDTFNGTNSALAGVTLAVSTSPSTPNVAVAGSVLSNDTDPDTPHANLTASAGTSSTQGGVVAFNADGSFSYTPAPGFTGTDTFTYTVHDNGSPDRTDTVTVTINVAGPRVWFVNPGGAGGGNGTSASPLNSLAPLSTGGASDALDGSGDVIFVYQGTGNATSGGLVLEANQRLVGQPQGLSVTNGNGTYNLVTAGGSKPTITNSSGAGVTLASGSTVSDVAISGASGAAIAGTNTGGSSADDLTVSGANGGVALTGAAAGTFTFTGITIDTTGGTGFLVSSTGTPTINIGSAGTESVSATGGSGVDIGTINGASSIAFDSVTAAGGTFGISLASTGTVNASFGSGSLTGSTADFRINGGSGTVSYSGTLADGTGLSADLQNRSGGSIALSGNITDGSDAGGGITMASNAGGSTTFSGSTKTLNTGASAAFSSTGSGHAITFSGGGLDIDTTSAGGFSATGGGTINVTGSGNTITSTTGTALNVANTTIGASGITFQSVSGNGATNGVVLNNTGSSGGLTVTGDSGSTKNGSGGTIQNTSSNGIALTSTRVPSFDQMNIQSTGGSGVRGFTAVQGFTFTNGTINNSGTGGGNQESSIAFNDPSGSATDAKVTGTVTITGNTLTNALWHGVSILQFAGALDDVNISNNTLTSGTTTGTGGNSFGSGIQLFVDGQGTTAGTVTRAELNNNTITNFPGGVLMAVQCGTANAAGPTADCGTPGSATDDIEIKSNILNGGGTTPDGSGNFVLPNQLMLLTVNGRGEGQFTVQNNGTVADPLSGSAGNNIDISAGGAVTVQATVTGNQMDAAGQTVGGTSGIAAGVGPFTVTGPTTLSTSTLYATVQNNSIKNSAGSGIRLNVNAGSPTLNAIVTGNTVTAPISATYGMQVVQGNNAGFTGHANVQISGNTSTGGTGGGNTFPGIGLRKFGTATNEFSIVGLTPSPATNAQMESYVAGINTSTSGTFGTNGVAAVNGSSSNWTSIVSVPQP